MEGTDPGAHVLLEQARAELADLERRVDAVKALLDRALEAEAGEAPRKAPRFRADTDPANISAARSVASHMAFSGHPRWSAEDRLRGMVSRRELRKLLDEVYGPPSGRPRRS